MITADVTVIIPVHSAARPIGRAVESVLAHNDSSIDVLVVAHNIDVDVIRARLGTWANHPRLQLAHIMDGIPSPSGPFNLGISLATGRFISVMGSDDTLESGAIDSWLTTQRVRNADIVIPRVQLYPGATLPTPPSRPLRTQGLTAFKDRLSYRSAPLGLVSRDRFGHLRFPEGLKSGEDIPFVLSLWHSGVSIAFDRRSPAYLIHDDANDRVTFSPRSIADDFAFLSYVIGVEEFDALPRRERAAIALKFVRNHAFVAVHNRRNVETFSLNEREELAAVVRRILDWGESPQRVLSRHDQKLLKLVLEPESPAERLCELAASRTNYRQWSTLLPTGLFHSLRRQAPLRTVIAGTITRRAAPRN